MTARGLRLNNPGNLRLSADKWQGLAEKRTDAEFFTFKAPEWGIRALARTLIAYQDKHGLTTVSGMIGRWAPASENDTAAYIADVAQRSGLGADNHIDVHTYADARPLVEAIIHHENGQQPYPLDTINKGLALAGIEVPVAKATEALDQSRPLGKTRTVTGGKVAAAGTTLAAVADAAQQVASATGPLMDTLEVAKWLFLGATIIGVVIMLWARLSDRRAGLR